MSDRRFSFMDPLVLAIAAGEKDVTRRMIVPRFGKYVHPRAGWESLAWTDGSTGNGYLHVPTYWTDENGDVTEMESSDRVFAPYRAGDVLAVCEAMVPSFDMIPAKDRVVYRADRATFFDYVDPKRMLWPWKVRVLPARYCPAWAVRYRRRILSVRPERLSWITDDEVRREGVTRLGWEPTAAAFVDGFRKMHGLDADADPWVWRVEFDKVEAPHVR